MSDSTLPAPVVDTDAPEPPPLAVSPLAARTREEFDLAARKVAVLAEADILPPAYRNHGNLLVALDVAERTGIPLLAVCQNLHVIQGRPGWSAAFIIAAINADPRWTTLDWRFDGDGDDYGCTASATEAATGRVLEGEKITRRMVQGEGWDSNRGSKWKTMPGQMYRYRAAAFWARIYAPSIVLGLHFADEIRDVGTGRPAPPSDHLSDAQAALEAEDEDEDIPEAEVVSEEIEPADGPAADPDGWFGPS